MKTTLTNEIKHIKLSGNQSYRINTLDLSSGLYFINIMSNEKKIYSGLINHVNN